MADIPEVTSSDPVEMLGVGRRHLAVRDYSSAVGCLGKACELLAQKHGQHADECGEAYLWYGKSLLGLAREESGVLGDGIPQGSEENQEDEEEDDEAGEDDNDETDKNGEAEDKKTDESEATKEGEDESEDKKEGAEKSKAEEAGCSKSKDRVVSDATVSASEQDTPAESTSGPSKSEGDAVEEEEEEDEVENLQVAWEVLELARDIFLKRGERGKNDLADVYLHLGEVSLESETYDKAVVDMGKSLELFQELYNSDDRRIAETHYQIGLAHSLSNGFEDAITHFKAAAEILESRIKSLESPSVATDDANVKKYLANDPFYSVEGEIKELKELLPEIQEKIQDMIDYKTEAIKSVRETLGIASNGQSSSSSKANGSSSQAKGEEKKASDISHLVRRKRKPSEEGLVEESAAKKVAQ